MKRGQIAQSLKDIENRENARNRVSLEQRIAQAGLEWTRKKYYVISLGLALFTGLLLLVLSGSKILGLAGLFIGGFGLLTAWTPALNLLALGILGEYVGRIAQEVRNRPLFVGREVHGVAQRPSGRRATDQGTT